MYLRSRTQNQQVSEHRKKYSEKMPGAVSEKNRKPVKLQDKKMENIRSTPLFYKCESKKWEPVYWLALTG